MIQKLRIEIAGGVPGDSFFCTVIIREAISEKRPLGKKLPKSDATVKYIFEITQIIVVAYENPFKDDMTQMETVISLLKKPENYAFALLHS